MEYFKEQLNKQNNRIFLDIDYFEMMILNYDQFNLASYDYFSLKELIQIILNEIGFIPSQDEDIETSDYSCACSLIENYQNKHHFDTSWKQECFVFTHRKLKQVLHCRVIEKPIILEYYHHAHFQAK